MNVATTFSSGKIDICSACKAKYVAVNLFVACSTSLKKKTVLTVLKLCHYKLPGEKKIMLKKCVRPKIIITMIMMNTKMGEPNKLSKSENTHTSKQQKTSYNYSYTNINK
jgi:hypothetical protein